MKKSVFREIIHDITRSKYSRERILRDGLFVGVMLFLFFALLLFGK